MNLIEISVKRPVLTVMLITVLVVIGIGRAHV